MTEPLVRFEHIQKSYDGEVLVVKDLNLEIQKGEFLTMLGPSGSGKTTVLMMLAGFEVPTYGNIFLRDQAIDSVAPHKRGFGMVFQNYALFPHMTVGENLAFPLQVRGVSRSEISKKVAMALSMVRLDEMTDRRVSQLSGGQQQRVAVARALVFEPELVLMDEPLGALDKNLREELQYEIKHLHESLGLTVVYVTHDQSEALTMSNRIAVFDSGVIQQIDSPAVLYEQPANFFVAGFIGENNRFGGTIKHLSKDGKTCTVALDNDTHELKAAAVNINGVNSKTNLSLRPERVSFAPEAASKSKRKFTDVTGQVYDSAMSAKIEELVYLGDHIRVRANVAGNDQFIVKVPNNQKFASLAVGQKTTVVWNSSDCRALDNVG